MNTPQRQPARAGATASGLALAAGLEAATYPLWRDWCLTWGAAGGEVTRPLAGDDLIPDAPLVSTRAIGIAATPDAIWPWLVQMGPGRGGAYTYDWAENIFGLNMHSADTIIPEFRDLAVGDGFGLGRHGPVLRVAMLDPRRSMVLRSDDGAWTWSFTLTAADSPGPPATRLISRNRFRQPPSPLSRAVTRYLMEPGSLVMERKMLLGIKERAERRGDEL